LAEVLRPDVCVIGAGAAGLAVAAAAAAFDASVVLVEKGKMGGSGLNCGSVPSRALIAAANRAHDSAAAGIFGVDAEPRIDFARVHRHIQKTIAAIAPDDAKERFTGLGVQVISGTGAFTNRRTVTVDGKIEIKARRFVIATGSSPAIPPIPGLAETPYLTNETVFDLTALPSHLVVLGGNPIGLEFAQAFRRLGAQVTVLEVDRPLPTDDAECAVIVLDALAGEGVAIRAGTAVTSVRGAAGGFTLTAKHGDAEETITASHLLVAGGRVPRFDGLGLKYARIKHGPGGIVVNRHLKTSNRRVYAVGDATGALMLTHVADYHAGIVVRDALYRLPAKVSYTGIPRVTYTDPELAHVGLSEEEAKRKGSIRLLRWSYHDNDRAQAERTTRGHLKVVTSKSGRVLGATIVGAHAGDLIAPWTLAIAEGINISAMAQVIAPYPTFGEINKRAAMSFSDGAENSTMQRIVGWFRRLR
jgi:pyruvate/2-oxoglutarate dehydrogenase complex dihydrolipoamide dehydrogenase (E3) component